MIVQRKKMIFIKDGKADFIEDHHVGIGTTAMVFYTGGQISVSTKYSRSKWEFIAKKQGESNGYKITTRKYQK